MKETFCRYVLSKLSELTVLHHLMLDSYFLKLTVSSFQCWQKCFGLPGLSSSVCFGVSWGSCPLDVLCQETGGTYHQFFLACLFTFYFSPSQKNWGLFCAQGSPWIRSWDAQLEELRSVTGFLSVEVALGPIYHWFWRKPKSVQWGDCCKYYFVCSFYAKKSWGEWQHST